jgi:hypothetical protein
MPILDHPRSQQTATGAAPEAITKAGQVGIEVDAVALAGGKREPGNGPIGQPHWPSGHQQGISQAPRRGRS